MRDDSPSHLQATAAIPTREPGIGPAGSSSRSSLRRIFLSPVWFLRCRGAESGDRAVSRVDSSGHSGLNRPGHQRKSQAKQGWRGRSGERTGSGRNRSPQLPATGEPHFRRPRHPGHSRGDQPASTPADRSASSPTSASESRDDQPGSSRPPPPGVQTSPRRGRFMGPEIRTPVASRVAPHRQYVPADRPAPSTSPRDENRRGLYPGEPESLPPPAPALRCGRWHSSGCCWRSSRDTRSRAGPSSPWPPWSLGALPVHYLAPYRWKKPLFAAISIGGPVLGLRHRGGRDRRGPRRRPDRDLLPARLLDRPRRRPGRAGRGPGRCCAASPGSRPSPRPSGHPGDHVHVPPPDLHVRAEARARPRDADRHDQLLLPAAQLLLHALSRWSTTGRCSGATSPTTSTRSSGGAWR